MTDGSPDDDVFVAERARLIGVAYRITGSRAEAEDIVQDAWLRWQAADRLVIERPEAWLTTVTSRIALDRLSSARHRRETYVGPWLPEIAHTAPGPDDRMELAETLTVGFLVVLERLAPVERVVFLLADVFRVPFDEIAAVVDRSPVSCRQIASRARRRVQEERPRFAPTDDEAWRVTAAFLAAATAGDIEALTAVLAPDVVETADGGGVRRAGVRPVVGADRVARLLLNIVRRDLRPDMAVELRNVNGQPGIVVRDGEEVESVMVCSVVDGKVDRIWVRLHPEKIATVESDPIA